MKKSDEQRNEELRRLLGRTFDDFGREPNDDVWNRIRAVVPSREPWYARRLVKRAAVLSGLALFIMGGWKLSDYWGNTLSKQQVAPSAIELAKTLDASRKNGGLSRLKNQPNQEATGPTVRPNATNLTELRSLARDKFKSVESEVAANTNSTIEKCVSRSGNIILPRTSSQNGRPISRILKATSVSQKELNNSAGYRQDVRQRPINSSTESPKKIALGRDDESGRDVLVVHNLTNKPVSFPQLLLPALTSKCVNNAESVIATKKTIWRLTGDLMPLNTFQVLTTRNVSETRLQNIQLPSLFTPQTAGFKVTVGVARDQWKAQMTFTSMKRWAIYEVARDEFHIMPVSANNWVAIRLGIPIFESTTLTLLGLGVNREYRLLDRKRVQIFVIGGGEAIWSFTTRQAIWFVSGSAGVSFKLSNQTALRVAPNIDFSLTQLRDAKNLIDIRPYNIGLKVGIETGLSGRK